MRVLGKCPSWAPTMVEHALVPAQQHQVELGCVCCLSSTCIKHLLSHALMLAQDYFEFESGDPRTGRARGVNPETQAAIRRWLDNNK